ncbi:phytoene/squalene synthase family protein [Pedobacter aquatilis]|uniref:phytoene/squalene synthase family protein n=1 Tax=Pedobacter aquatilis TaxID=351343 RepID=UPI0025B4E0A4|nr:phytoene/squalene synthase family protein [Pedobacter aquatilis]MDN3588465.1 phytoene/squalene synthase family protein [Pedobacter aquatilis]
MKSIYDSVSMQCSRIVTRNYSTSFSLGIRFLDKTHQDPIHAIYGFVRLADEIVDSFHEFDKATLLLKFKRDCNEAIAERISLNPILNAFQKVVNHFNINLELIDLFLQSMEMDLNKETFNNERYEQYILGSAEVVGLMCLSVFVGGNKNAYEKLKEPARKLGSAFQKVNFLRDVKDDFNLLGRNYFPGVNLSSFSASEKLAIEAEIIKEFKEALGGIKQLPPSAKKGVYLAYTYYKKLFNKIQKKTAEQIMGERIRISNGHKISLMVGSTFRLTCGSI